MSLGSDVHTVHDPGENSKTVGFVVGFLTSRVRPAPPDLPGLGTEGSSWRLRCVHSRSDPGDDKSVVDCVTCQKSLHYVVLHVRGNVFWRWGRGDSRRLTVVVPSLDIRIEYPYSLRRWVSVSGERGGGGWVLNVPYVPLLE